MSHLMFTTKRKKEFDAVKFSREQKDKLSAGSAKMIKEALLLIKKIRFRKQDKA